MSCIHIKQEMLGVNENFGVYFLYPRKNSGTFLDTLNKQSTLSGENYQESESSVEHPLPMICTRKIYF